MTCIIAIETATEACSAAILVKHADDEQLYKRFQLAPREHTKLILPMLDEVLNEASLKIADVDAIAFGRGPGAFTGLRIATGIAQGLALSVGKPTIAISSLHAMALAGQNTESISGAENIRLIVAIDARMGEVYWAEYSSNNGVLEIQGEEQLSAPTAMFEKTKELAEDTRTMLIGSGWDVYYGDFLKKYAAYETIKHITDAFPDAEQIVQLALAEFDKGEFQEIEEAQPVYLRNNVAEKSKKPI